MKEDICIKIVIESSKSLTTKEIPVCLNPMPNLRLSGEGVPDNHLSKLIQQYADWLLASCTSERYVSNVERGCRKICLDCGWFSPGDITSERMMEYLAAMQRSGRKSKTRNHQRNYMHGFCSWLVRKEILSTNPIELVPEAPELDKVPRAVPSVDEVGHLVAVTKRVPRKKDRWLVYTLAASTGLRHGELKGLLAGMYRDGEYPHFDLPPVLTKSKVRQLAFIPHDVNLILREHLRGFSDDQRVVISIPKWESFEGDRKLAGIPKANKAGHKLSFHSLRHYFSSRLIEAGIDLEHRAKLMRHGGLGVTSEVYTTLSHQRMSEKINKATFFPIDTDPDPPIDCTYNPVEEAKAMTQLARASDNRGEGSNPVSLITPRNNPPMETTASNGGGVSVGTPQQPDSPQCDTGGGDDQTSHGGGSLSAPAHAERQSSRAHNALSALPGSVSPGRAAEGHLNNQSHLTDAMLAEAFLAGVRVGRGQRNGDTE